MVVAMMPDSQFGRRWRDCIGVEVKDGMEGCRGLVVAEEEEGGE